MSELEGTLEEKIKGIIVSQLGVEESAVISKAKFIEDLGADSLDIVELVMAMEEPLASTFRTRSRKYKDGV